MVCSRGQVERQAEKEADRWVAVSRIDRVKSIPPAVAVSLFLLGGLHAPDVASQGGAVPPQARQLKDALTGDAKGAAALNPQCRLLTPSDIARFVGLPVKAGQNAAMGHGCQWASMDDEADAMIVVLPSRYHEHPYLAPGFKALAAPGQKAFVVPEMGGWAAGTILGERAVKVSLTSPHATEQTAVALLREVVTRLGP